MRSKQERHHGSHRTASYSSSFRFPCLDVKRKARGFRKGSMRRPYSVSSKTEMASRLQITRLAQKQTQVTAKMNTDPDAQILYFVHLTLTSFSLPCSSMTSAVNSPPLTQDESRPLEYFWIFRPRFESCPYMTVVRSDGGCM